MNCYNEGLPKDAQLAFWGKWIYSYKGTILASERTVSLAIACGKARHHLVDEGKL
jgi:hypothetical protein